jgi:hypothetical protein
MSLHSSQLMIGGSPQTRSAAETDAVFHRIQLLLKDAALAGATFVTLRELTAKGALA